MLQKIFHFCQNNNYTPYQHFMPVYQKDVTRDALRVLRLLDDCARLPPSLIQLNCIMTLQFTT